MEFKLDVRTKKALLASIKGFVLDTFDRDIGELKAERTLEFMVKVVGATAYNRGVSDAQAWVGSRVADMAGELYTEVDAKA